MTAYELALASFAVYMVSYIVSSTAGPARVFYELQKYDDLPFHCFYCMTPYVSALICLQWYNGFIGYVTSVLAVAGVAILLYKIGEYYGEGI